MFYLNHFLFHLCAESTAYLPTAKQQQQQLQQETEEEEEEEVVVVVVVVVVAAAAAAAVVVVVKHYVLKPIQLFILFELPRTWKESILHLH